MNMYTYQPPLPRQISVDGGHEFMGADEFIDKNDRGHFDCDYLAQGWYEIYPSFDPATLRIASCSVCEHDDDRTARVKTLVAYLAIAEDDLIIPSDED